MVRIRFPTPHAPCLQDVYMADALVSQVETAVGRKKKLGFGLIIEATMGSVVSGWGLYVPSG